jgi:hypothetical protein
MFKRNSLLSRQKFNVIYTSSYDLRNHGIVTFSKYPIWTPPIKKEKIKWLETGQKFKVPRHSDIINGNECSFFLFKNVYESEIIKHKNWYEVIADVRLVLLPVCIYRDSNKKLVEEKQEWWEKIVNQSR